MNLSSHSAIPCIAKVAPFFLAFSCAESPYAVSIAMDVVNKCNHMAHAGNDIELEPHIHNFFNKGESRSLPGACGGIHNKIMESRSLPGDSGGLHSKM